MFKIIFLKCLCELCWLEMFFDNIDVLVVFDRLDQVVLIECVMVDEIEFVFVVLVWE